MSTILSWFSVEGASPTPAPLNPTIEKVRERLPQGEDTGLSSPTGGPPLQKRVPWTSRVERDMRRDLEEADYPSGPPNARGLVGTKFWNESSRDVVVTVEGRNWKTSQLAAGRQWAGGMVAPGTTYTFETFENPPHKAKKFVTTSAGSQHVFIVDLERPAIVERFWEVRPRRPSRSAAAPAGLPRARCRRCAAAAPCPPPHRRAARPRPPCVC